MHKFHWKKWLSGWKKSKVWYTCGLFVEFFIPSLQSAWIRVDREGYTLMSPVPKGVLTWWIYENWIKVINVVLFSVLHECSPNTWHQHNMYLISGLSEPTLRIAPLCALLWYHYCFLSNVSLNSTELLDYVIKSVVGKKKIHMYSLLWIEFLVTILGQISQFILISE